MQSHTKRTRVVSAVAGLAMLAVVAGPAAADEVAPAGELPGDSSIPFWPHETGALVGTSETYVDLRDDGSYFDPSIGRRVLAVQLDAAAGR
jgi:hypothetical protein